jgi:chromosome segregation ATPase
MNDEPNPSHDPPNDPPKPSTGFKGKLPKRRLTRKKGARRKSHDLQQEDAGDDASSPSAPELHADVDGEPAPPAEASTSTSLRSKIEARGAKRKITNAEYEFELKRIYSELDASEASLRQKDLEILALTKRNKTLSDQFSTASDAVRASRSAAREAGSTSRSTSKEAKTEMEKLSRLLEKVQAELLETKKQLYTSEAEMKQQSEKHKLEIEAMEKAKVSQLF